MPHVPAVRCPALMAVLVLILFATPLAAQSGHNLERPDHWKARYDDGTSAPERRFVVMRPGWHVFAGPGGLFWDPGSFASGAFAVSSTIFLVIGVRAGAGLSVHVTMSKSVRTVARNSTGGMYLEQIRLARGFSR